MKFQANIFMRIFYLMLVGIGLFIFFAGLYSIVTEWNTSIFELVLILLGSFVGLWLCLYSYSFVFGSVVKLDSDKLIIKNWKNKFSNLNVERSWVISDWFLPKSEVSEVKIDNIEQVLIGTLSRIQKTCHETGDTVLEKEIKSFSRKLRKNHLSNVRTFHSSRRYMYLKLKAGDSKIVDVSLFSKRSLEDLHLMLQN